MKTKYDKYTNDNQIKMFEKGQIFYMEDNHQRSNVTSSHMYLIMNDSTSDPEQMYTCMAITSRKDKSTDNFIPIACNTYEIGYIDPFNLYSFYEIEFKLRSYRGVLSNDILNKYDFIDMLMDLFLIYNGFQPRLHENDVFNMYNAYIEEFWKKYDYLSEHRDNDGGERKIFNTVIKDNTTSATQASIENSVLIKDNGDTFTNPVISGLDKVKIENAIKQHDNKKTVLFRPENISKQEQKKSKTNINYDEFLKPTAEFTDSEIQLYVDIWKEKGSIWLNNKLGFIGRSSSYNKKVRLMKEAEKRGLVIK